MRNETLIDLTDHLDLHSCERWLGQLRRRTADQGVQRLVDEVTGELRLLGDLVADMADVVVGALASVEAAVDVVTV